MKKQFLRRIGFWTAIILVFILIRTVDLTIIPVFADEAIYIHWAIRAWHNATERFISFSDGKPPLHTWLMIPFLKIISDPLVAGRLLSVLSGLATLIGTFLLGKRLFGQKKALWVIPFALFSPFLLFYDRLAVADSLLTAFLIWSCLLTYRFFDKPDLGNFFILTFSLVGGLLTKQTGIYGLFMVVVIFIFKEIVHREKEKHPPILVKIIKALSVIILAYIGYSLIVKLAPNSHLLSSRTYDYILGKREWLNHPFQLVKSNTWAIIYWIASYQTKSWLLLCLVLPFVFPKYPKQLGILIMAVLIPVITSAFVGRIIFPRYFVIVQPYLNIILGLLLAEISQRITGKKKYLLGIIFLEVIIFDWWLLTNPSRSPLIEREQNQYLTGWSSGYGIKEIAGYLKSRYQRENVNVYTEGYFGTLPDGLLIYLDRYSNISVAGIGQPIYELPSVATKSASIKPTFLIANSTRLNLKPEDQSKIILVDSYPKPRFPFLTEELFFYQVNPIPHAE